MGASELQGRGETPQGRGCLLLAVAGATFLVTLLLAVPITILAVLTLVPQEQESRVMETTGLRAQRQQGLDPAFQEVSEKEPETDLSSRPPAAHLIGAPMNGQGLGWEAKKEEAFLSSGAQFSGSGGLALPLDGLYYLYCQVGYRGRAPPAGGDPRGRSFTLRSSLYRIGGAYGPGSPELLLESAETVVPGRVGAAGRVEYAAPFWFTSVGFGGLVQLRSGERVYVNISHPHMVDYSRGKTFFGAVMVG
ncbi:PREDICTED: lymphotoxin-beta isoform X1 [Dipodomys ordii]|uniref:Lymphotoxin-beta n=1 Tax=Dipodomys ordii TaxID=10020 RepID=A0A1S3GEX9_DIPOR|nr:PREDICTED: lymphotoxin-beta isoform X1 [Dipodomys ordii]XP_042539936.1 lymphotoxin-beta isoform X2 [Dipodomys spectabilis]